MRARMAFLNVRGGYDARWKFLFRAYLIAILLVLLTGCMFFHLPGVHLPGTHGIGIGAIFAPDDKGE